VLFTCADAGQQIATAIKRACDELGEDLVRFPRLLPFSERVLIWWTVARRGIASLYDLDSITDDDELRLSTSSRNNTYMLRAVDRSVPVDVRYRHLSSGLADSVLSQRSPSPQSIASVLVCYLSCHVFAIADRPFSQWSASPQLVAFLAVGAVYSGVLPLLPRLCYR
jgi:hypothetical protein